MEKCPTCNAKYKGGPVCYRCKSDFSHILDIEKEAAFYLALTKVHLKNSSYDKALEAVEKSLFLLHTKEGSELKSYILALMGSFEVALQKRYFCPKH